MVDQKKLLAAVEAATDMGIREHLEGMKAEVALVIMGKNGVTVNFDRQGLRYRMEITPEPLGHRYVIREAA